jgi:pimeloyl-ACP methyl ester carboxylesterase
VSEPAPTGSSWPIRLSTHVLHPNGTAGRALLLHGLGSDGLTWWRLGSQLADRGFLVLAPDLRSHGHSPTAHDHRIATLAGDVALLGGGWDLVVGHSLGGAVAAELLARPDLDITAAVLVDPALLLHPDDREQVRQHQRSDVGPLGGAQDLAARYPRWHPYDVERKLLAAAVVAPSVVDLVVDHNDPWDVTATADRWTSRVHLLAADPQRDELLGRALLDERLLASLTARGGVSGEVVVGAGHSIHRDDPDAVWRAVAEVLGDGG